MFLGVFLFLAIVAVGTTLIIHPAHAQGFINWEDAKNWVFRTVAQGFLAVARFCLKLTQFAVSFLMVIGGYNGYLNSTAVNVGWVMVRDITNMGFVVILLIIAFATILGVEQYEWKKLLPKFFFAAILVNFSRTICGVLIDLSQVIMITFLNGISATIGGNIIDAFNLSKIESFHEGVTPQELQPVGILIASMAALFFSILVLCVMGLYVLILLGRMLRLWILIVLSPLAFVLSVIPKTQSFASEWWSEFGDNLVTGPIILFFIWLSFVTVGQGGVFQDVSDNSAATSGATQEGGANVFQETFSQQQAGLTDILGWNSMANFAIAIGMLFAGAQVASRIGGSAGNLMQTALQTGKRVATIATGVAAGQWLYGKGSQGLRGAGSFLYDKTVGNRMARYGTAIKGRLGYYAGRVEEVRNKKAQELEAGYMDALKNKRPATWSERVGRFKASLIESEGRKMKRAHAWEEIAKSQEKIVDENYSTSGFPEGELKLEMVERQRAVEDLAKEKKGYKFKNIILEMGKRLQPYKDADLEVDRLQSLKEDNPERIAKLGEAIKKRDEMKAQLSTQDLNYYSANKETLKTTAKREELEHGIRRGWEEDVAKQKDNDLVKEGKVPRYLQAVLEKQHKEDMDVWKSSSVDRMKGNVDNLRDKIRNLVPGTENYEKNYNNYVKQMGDLLNAMSAQGTDFAVAGETHALKGMDIDVPDAGDVVGQQARVLTGFLQEKVDATADGINKAMDKLKQIHGDRFNSFMESFVNNSEKAAQDGAINLSGLFRGKLNTKTHQMDYHAVNLEDKEDREHSKEKRDYALSQSKAGKVTGVSSSVDRINGKVRIKSKAAVKRIADMFGPITPHGATSTDKQNIDTLSEAFANAENDDEIKTILAAMRAKATSFNNIKVLLKRTNLDEDKIEQFTRELELNEPREEFQAKQKQVRQIESQKRSHPANKEIRELKKRQVATKNIADPVERKRVQNQIQSEMEKQQAQLEAFDDQLGQIRESMEQLETRAEEEEARLPYKVIAKKVEDDLAAQHKNIEESARQKQEAAAKPPEPPPVDPNLRPSSSKN